jgi:hypothetical protein
LRRVFRLKGAEWVERSEKPEHDPEKACPDLIRGGYRLSEEIMVHE